MSEKEKYIAAVKSHLVEQKIKKFEKFEKLNKFDIYYLYFLIVVCSVITLSNVFILGGAYSILLIAFYIGVIMTFISRGILQKSTICLFDAMREESEDEINKAAMVLIAVKWRRENPDSVSRAISGTSFLYEPDEDEIFNPKEWHGSAWRWFEENFTDSIEIYEKLD